MTYEAHPVADLFPMLPDDELKDLAQDIAERGLLQPIVLDADGLILDGRNRYAACELASVEPIFETYEGDDADGFAWSINVKRRALTKAQTAIIAADRFADKNLSGREIAKAAGVSYTMIQWAQATRRYQDLHDEVLLRGGSLKDSYEQAVERDAAEEARQANLSRLREDAPDLLGHVEDGHLAVDDAVAALDAREEKAREEAEQRRTEDERLAAERRAENVEHFASLAGAIHTLALNTAGMAEYDDSPHDQRVEDAFLTDRLTEAREALNDIIKWSESRD